MKSTLARALIRARLALVGLRRCERLEGCGFEVRGGRDVSSQQPRAFINGWWHAASIEDAIESIELDLQAIGIATPVPRDALASAVDLLSSSGLDEEDQRRHQIGIVARFANLELAGAHRLERVRPYGAVEDPDDEPTWLVVTSAQHAEALLEYGAPQGIEAQYDDPDRYPDPVVTAAPPSEPRIPRALALGIAQQAMRDGDLVTALRAAEIAVAETSDHSLLAELIRIEALYRLGRHDDAERAWTATATSWLAGRRVWASQWRSLATLHSELGMPDDALIASVRPLEWRQVGGRVAAVEDVADALGHGHQERV